MTPISVTPDSLAFSNKKTSELLNNAKTNKPIIIFLNVALLLLKYCNDFRNETFEATGRSILLSLIKKVKLIANTPGTNAIKNISL